MSKTFLIDCFLGEIPRRLEDYAIVAIDIVRATTTAVTAAATGRACYVVPSLEVALELAKKLPNPMLAGEQGGVVPQGFDLDNSPSVLLERNDLERPLILLSSSGTRLCFEASRFPLAFVACLRNYRAVASYLERFEKVAIFGAGTNGEFREEDQLCSAWIASSLSGGWLPENNYTGEIVRRWGSRSASDWLAGKSADYLRKSGRVADIDFVLRHVGDVDAVFVLSGNRLVNIQHPDGLFEDFALTDGIGK